MSRQVVIVFDVVEFAAGLNVLQLWRIAEPLARRLARKSHVLTLNAIRVGNAGEMGLGPGGQSGE